jgi:hypothetical protein
MFILFPETQKTKQENFNKKIIEKYKIQIKNHKKKKYNQKLKKKKTKIKISQKKKKIIN